MTIYLVCQRYSTDNDVIWAKMDCFQSLQLTAFKEGIACLQEHQEKCVMLKGDGVVKKQVMKIARQFLHSQATNIKLAPRN